MASEIGIALISTILEPMAAKAMEKVNAMVGNNVDDIVNIERDISKLQETLSMIQGIVQVAEEKQIDKQGKPRVFIQNWLRRLVDIGYEARDVLDDFITFSSCVITAYEEASNAVNFIPSFMLSYFGGLSYDTSNIPLAILNRLAKDIRSVSERFDEKKKEGETFVTLKSVVGEGSESVKTRKPVGPFINKQRDGLFSGREKVKEEIMEKILHPTYNRVDVVVIWGMGGIGKTTLAQSIYNDERVKKVPIISWLCVGENTLSAEKVIREILNDQNTIGIGKLQEKLVEKFRNNRFLIVLDDVWDVDDSEWNLLFNPLTNVGEGGMIIITRREKEVCPALINIQMEYYNLESLSEEDSWLIFESCAYDNGKSDTTPDLKGIGEKIVKKLNGHPLALKVIGGSLLHKDSSTWTDFLESNMFLEDDEVMSALRWSYTQLPPHLKACFTLCSLFPKDHVLDKKVLVEMWMAHDLIKNEKKKRPEDVGARYFKELENASLLQSRDDGKYVMHDLIHDLALLVSNGEFASTISSSLTNDQMKKVRHITITHGGYSKIQRLCALTNLLTLYTNDEICSYGEDLVRFEYSVLDDVFKQLKSIRVLILCNKEIKEIPNSISELRHLRYLDVRRTSVKSLPDSLCDLYHLQTLAAPLDAILPRNIVNISSLRYIRANLSTCKGVGKLTSLQELSSIRVCQGDNIRELGDIQILHGRLSIEGLQNVNISEDAAGALMEKQEHIDELELKFDKQMEESTISEEVLDALECPPNLTYLQIYGYTGVKLPSWMVDGKHKFHKLQTLVLDSCSKLESPPPLGKFANFMTSLSRLKIRDCDGLKWLQLDALVSLKELEIGNCNSLVQITSAICESLKISYCGLLEKMDVARCDSLQVVIKNFYLYECESLRSVSIDIHGLDSLEDLQITDCPTLELAFEDGSSSSSSSGNSVVVPIHNITTDNTQAFRTLLHHEFVSLESLFIINLGGFENFDETEANNFCKFRSLKILGIFECEDLKSLLPDFHKLSSLEILDINVCRLQSLPPDFHKLSSLKELIIDNWPQLQSLPPDFHKLSSLKKLTIADCPQLQSLPADGLPPSLSDLCIGRCPLLYERCKDESGLDWHKINQIPKRRIRPN